MPESADRGLRGRIARASYESIYGTGSWDEGPHPWIEQQHLDCATAVIRELGLRVVSEPDAAGPNWGMHHEIRGASTFEPGPHHFNYRKAAE